MSAVRVGTGNAARRPKRVARRQGAADARSRSGLRGLGRLCDSRPDEDEAPANTGVFVRRVLIVVGLALLGALPVASTAAASAPTPVTIQTQKPFGPAPGTFSATGAISDSGTFANVRRTIGGIGAPTFLINHLEQRFEGAFGSFTLRAEIKETLTADPFVLTGEGTWAVLDGTGAYATLRGHGTVTGTADEHTGVITRVYTGRVLF